ncbi:MAG: glycosyltransferase [Alistipes sp.]|nr:glycosyltransferase [Alistipes sp.]
MTISIIIPVYNVEKYIRECLDSIICQTFSDFEVLLIDDGSPDKSGDICDEYATKDPRFKVFHKPNGGVSSARNLGLENAQGEWVLFVDADDVIYNDCLEKCYNIATEDNLDLLQFKFDREINKRNPQNNITSEVLSSADFLNIRHNVCAACSFIKTSIIRDNSIRFNTNIKLAEDQLFILHAIKNSNRIKITNDVLYYYRPNEQSATNTAKVEAMIKSVSVLITEKQVNPEFAKIIDNTIIKMVLSIIVNTSDKQLLAKTRKLYNNSRIIHCDRAYNSARIFYRIAKINFRLAKFIYCSYIQIMRIG